MDGKNMITLAEKCGVSDVVAIWNDEAQKPKVERAIRDVASRCGPNDYFVFYYSGHGTGVKDFSGDEADSQDEALCFVKDEELARLVVESTNAGTRVLILTDCCNSGTIADLTNEMCKGRDAVSIAGCTDEQWSGDMGRGGIFTHSMLLAVDLLQRSGNSQYSVGLLYNATLQKDREVFNSQQDITIQTLPGAQADQMAWPLVPLADYTSPLSRGVSRVARSASGSLKKSDLELTLKNDPSFWEDAGISATVVDHIVEPGLVVIELDLEKIAAKGCECVGQSCVVQ